MASYLESDLQSTNSRFLFIFTYLLIIQSTHAQQIENVAWNGNWIADGTIFQIRVEVVNGDIEIYQIESMGFIWNSKNGIAEGNIARIEVEYAGVNGVIQAELIDSNTAVAFAVSCAPDFMVVCALAKNRQAIFKKIVTD